MRAGRGVLGKQAENAVEDTRAAGRAAADSERGREFARDRDGDSWDAGIRLGEGPGVAEQAGAQPQAPQGGSANMARSGARHARAARSLRGGEGVAVNPCAAGRGGACSVRCPREIRPARKGRGPGAGGQAHPCGTIGTAVQQAHNSTSRFGFVPGIRPYQKGAGVSRPGCTGHTHPSAAGRRGPLDLFSALRASFHYGKLCTALDSNQNAHIDCWDSSL